MFHTVELFTKLLNTEYFCWLNTFFSIAEKTKAEFHPLKEDEIRHEYLFRGFEKNGIRIFLRSYESEVVKYYELSILLNPKRLLVNNEYIEVTREEDLSDVSEKFRNLMNLLKKEYGKQCSNKFPYIFHNLSNYKVKRIDYCINVIVNNIDATMKLIKRGDIPKNFKEFVISDKKGGRKKAPNDSFYLMSDSKSVTINIYSKHSQMKKGNYFNCIDIKKAMGILRVEVQCNMQKITSIERVFDLESKDIFSVATYEISKKIILYYTNKIIGFEDFYTLKEAREKINACSRLKSKTKVNMINVIELINQKRSVYKARACYDNDDKFNKILINIKKMGINPNTIPEGWDTEISNPIHEIVKGLMPIYKEA